MQAKQLIAAVWALGAYLRSVGHFCCPDMWLPSWTLVTLPNSLDATIWLDLDCTQVHVPVNVPLLLQFWAEHADIW